MTGAALQASTVHSTNAIPAGASSSATILQPARKSNRATIDDDENGRNVGGMDDDRAGSAVRAARSAGALARAGRSDDRSGGLRGVPHRPLVPVPWGADSWRAAARPGP